MSEVKSFNQWMVDQGFNAIRHANCCRIAYEGGQQSMQAEIDRLNSVLDERTKEWLQAIECGTYFENVAKPLKAENDSLRTQLSLQRDRNKALDTGLTSSRNYGDGLQKRIDEISGYATELAEYASYAEIIGSVSHNRQAIRQYCDKIFAYNRAIDLEEEKSLRGEHE